MLRNNYFGETKTHYKLYKRGKNWAVMGISLFSLGLGMLVTGQPVSADVTATSTSSSAAKAETTSASSSSAAKAETTSASSSSAVKAETTSASSSSAAKAETTSASSSSAAKAETTSASSSSAVKAETTSAGGNQIVAQIATNVSKNDAIVTTKFAQNYDRRVLAGSVTNTGFSVSDPDYPSGMWIDPDKSHYSYEWLQAKYGGNQIVFSTNRTGDGIVYVTELSPSNAVLKQYTLNQNTKVPSAVFDSTTYYNDAYSAMVESSRNPFAVKYIANKYDSGYYNNLSYFVPKLITQTTYYVDKDGKQITDSNGNLVVAYTQKGLVGQNYTTSDVNVINGYYATAPSNSNGVMSPYGEIGASYVKNFHNGTVITYTQTGSDGTMSASIAQDGKVLKTWTNIKPSDPAIMYQIGYTTNAIKNPYIPQTSDVEYVYSKLGNWVVSNPDGSTKSIIYPNDPSDPTKIADSSVPGYPVIDFLPGYTPEDHMGTPLVPVDPDDRTKGYIPPIPSDNGTDTTITYTADKQKGSVSYVDDTTGKTLKTDSISGTTGSKSSYSTSGSIADYKKQGYELVTDGYPADLTFDNDDTTDQNFTVHLKHRLTPVNPTDPQTPGTPINPDEPDGPKWPTSTNYDKTVNETISYVDQNGHVVAKQHTDSVNFTRTVVVDNVTGEVITSGAGTTAWTATNGDTTFDAVVSPVVSGSVADKAQTAAVTDLNADSADVNETVTYTKVGSLVPSSSDGNFPGARPVVYPNDPSDATKVTPADVPTVPGYTAHDPEGHVLTPGSSYQPSDPTKDTTITYTADKQQGSVSYVDDTTGKTLKTDSISGTTGSKSSYSTSGSIADYKKQGYELVTDGYPADLTFDNDDTTDQNFTVHLKHRLTPVNPTDPQTPGTPINPDEPDGPKWPTSTNYDKTVNETISYVDQNGHVVAKQHTDSVNFTRTVVVDNVTGEVITSGAGTTAWTATNGDTTFDAVVSPVVPGSVADKAQTAAVTDLNADSADVNETVTYTKVGSLVPSSSDGNFPGAPTVVYPNDPSDATKVTPAGVPTVPGYTAHDPEGHVLTPGSSYQPSDPTKDTTITYTADKQKGSVSYVDDTTGKTLKTDSISGTTGSKSSYSTSGNIADYKKQGYELVTDGYPADLTFDNDDTTDQNFTVHLKHQLTPVNPTDPQTPGAPINPDEPDGPKWPASTNYDKTVNETVSYVDQNGHVVAKQHTDSVNFTRTVVVDNVTGEVITSGAGTTAWTATNGDTTFDAVVSPVVPGSVADKAQTAAVTDLNADSADVNETVTYTKVGSLVPSSSDGNFPGAPTVVYPNDPSDATKVTPAGVPTVPGYTAHDPEGHVLTPGSSYQPSDPTKDTTITYTADKQEGSVSYVDDTTGKTLKTDSISGTTGSKSSYSTSGNIADYKKQGYELVTDGYPADLTFDNDDTTDQNFTVHLKHQLTPVNPTDPQTPGAPINPDEPDGPKWPASTNYDKTVNETVSYVDQNGHVVAKQHTDSVNFTRTVVVDNVTGEVITSGAGTTAWTATNGDTTFDAVVSPVVPGSVADKAQTAAVTDLNADSADVNETVTYTKVGSLVPSSSDGNFPGAPTVVYPNDPSDATKVTPAGVPTVPGYTAHDPEGHVLTPGSSYQPSDPTKDTTITYTADKQQGSVSYVDDTTGKTLKTDSISGTTGSKSSYSTSGSIADYKKQGYELVTDGYPADLTFDNDDTTDQNFTVHLKHQLTPVNPTDPQTPGAPINPDEPDGPKWPASTNYDKTVNETVSYVDQNGHVVAKQHTDSVNFTRTVVVDNVTGEVITSGAGTTAWTATNGDTTFDAVVSPVVPGSVADKAQTAAVTDLNADSADVNETVTYTKVGSLVPSSSDGNFPGAPTVVYPNDPSDATKVTPAGVPTVPGYTAHDPEGHVLTPGSSYQPSDPTKDTTITYTADKQKGSVSYVDDTTGKTLKTDSISGTTGSKSSYSTSGSIADYKKQGYELVTDGYPADLTFDNDDTTDQNFTVHLKHRLTPVNPTDPQTPGTPINPDEPDGPKWPTSTNYDKTVNETVSYVDQNGHEVAKQHTDSVNFTRTVVVDNVTGEVITSGAGTTAWTATNGDTTFDAVVSPVVPGSVADKAQTAAVTDLNADSADVNETVTYTKVGSLVPSSSDGNFPGAPTVVYPNDPSDATKVTPAGVPTVPGYTAHDPEGHVLTPGSSYQPSDPTKDTTITYTADKQKGSVSYVDDTTGKTLKTDSISGTTGSKSSYSTSGSIADYKKQGYELVTDGYPADLTFDNDDTTDQNFTVHLKHRLTPVNPTDPQTPGTPINPDEPDGPKWPTSTNYDKTVNETISYVDQNGHVVAKQHTDSVNFTRTVVVDNVTGEVITSGAGTTAWTATNGDTTFDAVVSPVVPGSVADKAQTAAVTDLNADSADVNETVTYTKVGSLVPSSSDGNFPGAPTVVYPNDPSDATKVTPAGVPTVPGYTAHDPEGHVLTPGSSYQPSDPTKDTTITYTADKQKGSVSYVDDTTGKTLKTDSISGTTGSKSSYSTSGNIADYKKQGYELVTDGYPADLTFDNDDTTDQNFTVHLKHQLTPVNPTDPQTPGAPINPDEPDGPKWPTSTNYDKTVNETVSYVDQNGHVVAKPHTDSVNFTRTVVVDNVTGEVITSGAGTTAWTATNGDTTFDAVVSPVVPGSVADKAQTAAVTDLNADSADVNETVTYTKVGSLVPSSSDGNFPGAPTVVYPNDPSDATKVTPAGVPTVPGYTAHDPEGHVLTPGSSYQPSDPTKDTTITYTADKQKGSVSYVDDTTGKTLKTDSISGTTGSKSSYSTSGNIADYKKQGYELVTDGYPADLTFDNDDTTDQNFTVHLKHQLTPVNPTDPQTPGAPINPDEPDGPKWPTSTNYDKTVNETVSYVDQNGHEVAKQHTDSVNFTRTVVVDNVTGEVITSGAGTTAWTATNGDTTFDAVVSPVVPGSVADKAQTAAVTDLNADSADVNETVTYTKVGSLVPSSSDGNFPGAPTVVYPNDPSDATKVTPAGVPTVPGYTAHDPEGHVLTPGSSYQPSDPTKDTTITYTADKQQGSVSYVDDTTGKTLKTDSISGTTGSKSSYSTSGNIADYKKQGYELVTDGYPADLTFDNDDTTDQNFTVHLKHRLTPVNPTDPQTPGTPINPDEPDGPKWPTSTNYDKTVNETISYVDQNGHVVAKQHTDSVNFTRTVVVDNVTGEVITSGAGTTAWTATNGDTTFDAVVSPVVPGSVADKAQTAAVTDLNADSADVNETVTYTKVGSLVPSSSDGNFPGAPTVVYPNDPSDATKVTPAGVPTVPGYTAHDPEGYVLTPGSSYQPSDPTKDTTITYTADKQKGSVSYVDDTTGKTLKTDSISGTTGSKSSYSTSGNIADYKKQGYELVTDGYPADLTFDNDDTTDQNFTVHLKHQLTPVNPTDPQTPGAPINPDEPDGPKWPTSTNYDKTVNETVSYVDQNGHEVAKQHTDSVNFTRTVVVDNVTGEVITSGAGTTAWTATNGDTTFDAVVSPVVPGSVADKAQTAAVTDLNADSADVNETVTYTKVGSLVPSSSDGNFPGAPTVVYPNDPSDATKVTPAGVPTVPGYTAHDPEGYVLTPGSSYQPSDPTKDTTITYTADKQKGSVSYVDDTTGKTLKTDSISGTTGSKSSYSTSGNIADYKKQGYELVTDGYPADLTFDNDDTTDQNFTVHLKHQLTPVNPTDPQTPGAPINPDEPDGPKWPTSTNYDKTVNETVSYVDQNGHEVAKQHTDSVNFTRTVVVDNVTGEVITSGAGTTAWTATNGDTTFDAVVSPVVPGSVADKAQTAAVTDLNADSADVNETVTYTKVGSLVPSSSDGNFPGARPVVYPNDPSDATKVTPAGVPTVPGYTAHDPEGHVLTPGSSYQPSDPTKDTTITYTADKQQGSVSYVDDTTGKTLKTDSISGTTGSKSSYSTSGSIADYKKQGYELVTDGYPADLTFDNDDTTDQNFTVHLKHQLTPVNPTDPQTPGAPINPDEPDGPKWPASTNYDKTVNETVSYVDQNGHVVAKQHTDSVNFTRTVVVDNVTGEVITSGDGTTAWTATNGDTTFDAVVSPVVPGSVADKAQTAAVTDLNADSANVNETVTYTKVGSLVPSSSDGNFPGARPVVYPNDPSDATKVTPAGVPTVAGYTAHDPEGHVLTPGSSYQPSDPTKDTTITYTADKQQGSVSYVDDTTGETLKTDSISGTTGSKSSYSTSGSIADYKKQGYELVTDGYPADLTFDNDDTTDQNFTVHLKHQLTPVNPTDPQTPGAPINPDEPDGPKWPTSTNYDKTVNETVSYVDQNGHVVAKQHTDSVNFTRTVVVDNVTGEVITSGDGTTAWTATNGDTTFDAVVSPVVPGSVADKAQTAAVTDLNADSADVNETVTYTKVGSLVPSSSDGNFPGAPTVVYPNDPSDATKVTPAGVPTVPGYTAHDPEGHVLTPGSSYQPSDPTKDTTITYTADKQKGSVSYVDDTTGKTLKTDSISGTTGSKSSYSTSGSIADYKKQGYELVTDGYPADLTFDNDDTTDQNFTVHLKHQLTPVNPTDPQTPGAPINPDEPDGPKWPASTNYDKTVNETVSYVDQNGHGVAKQHTDSVNFTRTVVVDNVTGEVITSGAGTTAWTATNGDTTFDAVVSPVVPGSVADKAQTAAVTDLNADSADVNETVTYTKVGSLVPSSSDGNFPGAPTVVYPNDPSDATKVTPAGVPTVPGYTAHDPEGHVLTPGSSYQPSDPTKDTTITYTADKQQGSVSYVDDTTGKTLKTDSISGTTGSKSSYSTSGSIADYKKQGYELVTDGYPADLTFDNDDTTDQNFTVHLKHRLTPVNPTDPQTPGTPINPDEPDGPKWPTSTNYDKTVNETISYVDQNGHVVAKQHTDSVNFTRTVVVDNVTGEVITSGAGTTAWTATNGDTTFDAVVSPVASGSVADKAQTAAVTDLNADSADVNETVTYTKVGSLVPSSSDGNFPGARPVVYPNDPSDATKVTPADVPTVPGYTAHDPEGHVLTPGSSYQPSDPTKDTTITYTADKQQGSVSYVDDTTGKTLKTDSISGTTGSKSSYSTSGSIADYKKQGYELVTDGYPADLTFDNDDTTDQNFTVHLKHRLTPVNPTDPQTPGTPINPDEPDGPKWPTSTNYDKTVNETISYVDQNGHVVAKQHTDSVNFTRTVVVDNVTGEVITSGAGTTAWTATNGDTTFDAVVSPVVPGSVADKAQTAAVTDLNADSADVNETVTYTKVGSLVPSSSDGNFPGAPTVVYPNDPSDATKVTPAGVPTVPGYTAHDPEGHVLTPGSSYQPSDPTKDTTITYTADKQKGSVSYVDDTTGKTLKTDSISGTTGSKSSYSTSGNIADYKKQGYELVTDGYPADLTFDNDDTTDQNFTVHLKHQNIQSTEAKTVTETIHYQGAGNQTPADNTAQVTFTRQVSTDTVTGEKTYGSWSAGQSFAAVTSPVIKGYTPDQAEIGAQTVSGDASDLDFTVIYTKDAPTKPVNPSQPTTPAKPVQAGQAAATNFVDQRLPQTGETDQQHMTLSGLLLLAMSSVLGLFGMTKRQRKE